MDNLVYGMQSLVVGMESLGIEWAGGEAMVSLARDMMGISHRLDRVMVMVMVMDSRSRKKHKKYYRYF